MQSAIVAAQQLAEQVPAIPRSLSLEAAAHADALRVRFARLLKSAERVRVQLAENAMGGSQSCSGWSQTTVCVEELLYRHPTPPYQLVYLATAVPNRQFACKEALTSKSLLAIGTL